MMEYRIANKVRGLMRNNHGENALNTILIYTETGSVIHLTKEYSGLNNWHRNTISLGIAEASNPAAIIKATIESREKLDSLIKILESYRDYLHE